MERKNRRSYLNKIFNYILCMLLLVINFAPLSNLSKVNSTFLNKNITTNDSVFAKTNLEDLVVHYINVGQGDSIFIELPDNRTMLIDAGESQYGTTVVNYIKNLKYTKIDYVVLTHSDSDHCGGLIDVFEAFEVLNIYRPFALSVHEEILPGGEDLAKYYPTQEIDIVEITTKTYARVIKAMYDETYSGNYQSSINVSYDGAFISSTDATKPYMIEFHHPPKVSQTQIISSRTKGYPTKYYGSDASGKNGLSCVISLEYNSRKFLFTGDITTEGEADFIANLDSYSKEAVSNVDVLKVAHHGSKTSSSQEFVSLVNPSYIVIMVNEGEYSDVPNYDKVLARYKALWSSDQQEERIKRTDVDGDIVVSLSTDGVFAINNATTKERDQTKIKDWVVVAVIVILILIVIIIVVKNSREEDEEDDDKKRKSKKNKKQAKARTKKVLKKLAKGVKSRKNN